MPNFENDLAKTTNPSPTTKINMTCKMHTVVLMNLAQTKHLELNCFEKEKLQPRLINNSWRRRDPGATAWGHVPHTTQTVIRSHGISDYVRHGTLTSQQVKTSNCVTWLTIILRRGFTSTGVNIQVILSGRLIPIKCIGTGLSKYSIYFTIFGYY